MIEELIQLGVQRILRVGTCGGLQPDLSIGDLIIALSAVPADATATHLIGGEPHAPTADWELIHGAVHHAKALGKPVRVGPIVSSDVFYNPDSGQYQRWSDRGVLAVEMEAAMLFTVGALRKIRTGCLLIVSDVVVEGEFVRISDDDMKKRRRPDDRARAGNGRPSAVAVSPGGAVFLVNPASANGATGKRWPELERQARDFGLDPHVELSSGPGGLASWRARRPTTAPPSSSRWAATGRCTRSRTGC